MPIEDQGGNPLNIRASDAERGKTADRLTEAVGEGRLTLDEFTQRVDDAYAAATRDELEALTADLPALQETSPGQDRSERAGNDLAHPKRGQVKKRWKIAVLGGSDYKGRWRVPEKIGYFALLGGSKIDLREAVLESKEVEITLVSILGGSDVIVPRGVRVEVDSNDFLGGDTVKVDEDAVRSNAPVVRIRSYSILGGSEIRHPKTGRRGR